MTVLPVQQRMTLAEIRARHYRLMNPPGGRVSSELEIVSQAKFVRRHYRRVWKTPVVLAVREPLCAADMERLASPRPVDPATVELAELPAVPLALIIQQTAAYFWVRVIDIVSDRRDQAFVIARHIAMYLGKLLTRHSLTTLGRLFGNRDHTTVLHAQQKIERLVRERDDVAASVDIVSRAVLRVHVQRYAAGWA